MKKENLVSIIVPVYNEENNISAFYDRLITVLNKNSLNYEIIFVLDPCTDSTEKRIYELREKDKNVKMLVTSRRFGQPACTMAGVNHCSGDVCFVMDIDLQDPPELIPEMLKKWEEGYKVVNARRRSRKGETLAKRVISSVGYYIISKIADVEIPRDTGDFRLLDRTVIEHVKSFKEHDAFLKGIVSYVGFKQAAVEYDREERASGSGKYNRFTGSLRIGLNGIFSFSRVPLDAVLFFGVALLFTAIISILTSIFSGAHNGYSQCGSLCVVQILILLAGIQLICLGIMAQYLSRVFNEMKGRPGIIIDRMIGFENPGSNKWQ